jgi:hypothetical protein
MSWWISLLNRSLWAMASELGVGRLARMVGYNSKGDEV